MPIITDIMPLLRTHVSVFEIGFAADEPRKITGIEPIIRGRLGFHLKRLCCPFPGFRFESCDDCLLSAECLYLTLFAPSPDIADKQRLRKPLRPFVIVATGNENHPGQSGAIKFTLMGHAIRYSGLFHEAAIAAVTSLSLDVRDIRLLIPKSVFMKGMAATDTAAWTLSEWIESENHDAENHPTRPDNAPDKLSLCFLSPVRLVSEGKSVFEELTLEMFVRAAIRRLRDIKRAFGQDRDMGKIPESFHQAAESVRVSENRLYRSNRKRYSHSQEQEIFLNGYKGEISFVGQVGQFYPLLKAGEIIHLGKGSSCGNGRMIVVR